MAKSERRRGGLYDWIRPWLFRLEPQRAQALALAALGIRNRILPGRTLSTDLGLDLLGLRFPNRVGLAAGFDKSGRHLDALGSLGFGFIEVGTVTPRAQPGNPPPNLFRLVPDEALINRLGFNNDGAAAVARRLQRRRYRGICGVNIGKNRDTPLEDSVRDYVSCLRTLYPVADYVTINVSSPNTPGLRDLQDPLALRSLLLELAGAREQLQPMHGKYVPLLVKLSPDLDADELQRITAELATLPVDGLVATNTTTARAAGLGSVHSHEPGGLSGRPLGVRSVQVVRALRQILGTRLPIVGVGGILSGEDGLRMHEAGADLLQIYTGLLYRGPVLVSELLAVMGALPAK